MAFGLAKNVKSADFPKRNYKIMWDMLVSKYALHTASSLLKLKSEFHNSKLELMEKDPDEWISNLEGLQLHMNEFRINGNKSDKDFMIHVSNNLPED